MGDRRGLGRSGAAHTLTRIADRCRQEGQPLLELLTLFDATRLGTAGAASHRLIELAPTVQGRWAPVFAQHLQARLERDPAQLEHVADTYEGLGAIPYAVDALVDACTTHENRASDQGHDARRAETRARRLAALCGAAPPLSLHRLGPARRSTLTVREIEVAELAAQGLPSRAIAERLFVSKRTVDNQLGRIYDKLGIKGRSEIADALPVITD